MLKFVLDIKDYTPQQLKKFLTPIDVQKEFGIDKDKLKYLRECSRDEGKLRGPQYLQDGLMIMYQRKSVIIWINKSMFQASETSETRENIKTSKTNRN